MSTVVGLFRGLAFSQCIADSAVASPRPVSCNASSFSCTFSLMEHFQYASPQPISNALPWFRPEIFIYINRSLQAGNSPSSVLARAFPIAAAGASWETSLSELQTETLPRSSRHPKTETVPWSKTASVAKSACLVSARRAWFLA